MLDRENSSNTPLSKMAFHSASRAGWILARLCGVDSTWEGSWPGNDTLWRTILDINRILLFADKEGIIQREPQRKVLSLIDGIIAGEGDGPLSPRPKAAGVIIAGFLPPTVDAVMATVMGMNYRKIPTIREALGAKEIFGIAIDADKIPVVSNIEALCGPLSTKHRLFSFTPARHWECIRMSNNKT